MPIMSEYITPKSPNKNSSFDYENLEEVHEWLRIMVCEAGYSEDSAFSLPPNSCHSSYSGRKYMFHKCPGTTIVDREGKLTYALSVWLENDNHFQTLFAIERKPSSKSFIPFARQHSEMSNIYTDKITVVEYNINIANQIIGCADEEFYTFENLVKLIRTIEEDIQQYSVNLIG